MNEVRRVVIGYLAASFFDSPLQVLPSAFSFLTADAVGYFLMTTLGLPELRLMIFFGAEEQGMT